MCLPLSGSMAYLFLPPVILMGKVCWGYLEYNLGRKSKPSWNTEETTGLPVLMKDDHQCYRTECWVPLQPHKDFDLWSSTMSCSQIKSSASPETEESLGRKAEDSCGMYSLFKVHMVRMRAGICSSPSDKFCFGGTEEMGRLTYFLCLLPRFRLHRSW